MKREPEGLLALADDGKPKGKGCTLDAEGFVAMLLVLIVALFFYWLAAKAVRSDCLEAGGQYVTVGGNVGCIYPVKAK